MPKPTAPKAELFAHALKRVLLGVFAVVGLVVSALALTTVPTAAATSNTVNFQARLETTAGSIAADGNYNVEFKLYDLSTSSGSSQGSCTGDADCLWTETRTGANQVHVTNGYLTVNLGSVNAFPSTVNWNQQLYLTMNIGGTGGTPSWDGEMSPRLKLTATPYSFQAGALSATSGANIGKLSFGSITGTDTITLPDASGTVCLQSSSACGFATGSGSAFLQGGNSFGAQAVLGTNDANGLAFRTNGTSRWVMDTSGNIQLQQASTFSVASAATGTQLTIQGGAATSGTNVGGNLLLQGGAGASTGASGSVIVKSNTNNSTTAFQVQNAGGVAVFNVDTTNQTTTLRAGSDQKTLGSELYAGDFSAGWTTAGWDVSGITTAKHNTGNTSALVNTSVAITAGATYQVSFSINGTCTVGNTVRITIGGALLSDFIDDSACFSKGYTAVATATTTAGLTFAPDTSNFAGTVSNISIKQLTGTVSPVLAVQNSSGVSVLEVRSSPTGVQNTFIGVGSGSNSAPSSPFGGNNTGIGYDALQLNTTGSSNSALGSNALQNNTTGQGNIAVGASALKYNLTGTNNNAIGVGALGNNLNGSYNTATGDTTLAYNTLGSFNSAFGEEALFYNTTGSDNTAVGEFALEGNTTGGDNTALGDSALDNNTTGSNNVGLGTIALCANATGSTNVALGYSAGCNDLNGFPTLSALQNAAAIGAYAQVQASNSIVLGSVDNATKVGIGITVPGNTFSVSPLDYQTGTATRTNGSATLVGTGTTWTSAMVGDLIVFKDGTTNTVSAFTDATHITMGTTYTGTTDASPKAYRFHHVGLQVASSGNVGINTTSPSTLLDIENSSLNNGIKVANSNGTTLSIFNDGNSHIESAGIGTNTLWINADNNSPTNINWGGGNVLVSGASTFQKSTNTTTAFQIQNAAGDNNLFLANTTNPNLVSNASAETDATGWFTTTGTGTAPSSTTAQALYGNASLQANTSATANAGVKYDTTTLLSASTTYSLSFWAKIASGSFSVQAGRSDTDAFAGETTCTLSASTVTTTWTRFTCSFTTGATVTTGGYIFIRQSDSTARTWYLDGVQLEQAAAPSTYHEGSLQFNGTITSPTVFQNGSDTTAAVQIQNAAGTSNLFVADTFDSRVGIGTASPGALLEVSETNNGAQELLRLSNPSNGTSATSEIHFRSGTINTDKATIIQGYDGTNFYLALGAGNPATEAMRVVGGKLGIGTTTVNTILQVSGSNGAPVNSGNLTTGGVIENGTTGAANNWGVDDTGSSSTSYAWLQGAYANNGGTHIYLSLNPNGGNVGIGTVSPGSTIQVNGNLAVGYSSSTAALASGISSNGDISIASNTDNAGLFIAKSGAYSNLEHNTGNGIEIDSANNTYGMYMGADPTNGLSYIQSVHIGVAATHLTLNPRGGFVAIGTQNFSSSLLTVGSSTSCALTGNFICGDYAEYYNSSEIAAAGDIMSVDASSSSGKLIKHASTAYDSSVVGIVSTTPAFVIEEGHMDIGGAAPTEPTLKPPIALAGRIPVKLSTINGPIHIGDAITSSDLVGFGMKATRAGTIVGKAMQEFDPANGVTGQGIIDCPAGTPTGVVCGEIFVFANTSWYDPDANLSGLGNFAITTGTQGGDSYQITDPSGSLVTRYGAYLGLDAANLQAGGIIAKNITTDTLMVNGLATFNGNLAVGGHIVTSGTTPAATAVLGAGTDTNGASNATCTVTGNDVSGVLTLATGDHSLADGAQCVVTFAKQFDIAPHPVITPLSKDSASVGAYLNATAQDMTILFSQAPLPSHTYSFNFLNIQ